MSVKSIFYKLNNELVKEFEVYKSNNLDTLFIIKDFLNIDVNEIVRMLRNNRKILISDHTVLDMNKLLEIKDKINDNQVLFLNLLISKECYIKNWFHNEYYEVLKELEISNMFTVEDIVRSESFIKTSIKLKYFDSPSYLLKTLDNSLFIKKMSLESFDVFKYDLANEFNKLIDFYKEIIDNLVPSTSIFIEQFSKENNLICNVVDNLAYEELVNIDGERVGIVSAIDISKSCVAEMNEIEKMSINIKPNATIGWIDMVDLKHKVKTLNIDRLYIKNLEKYDNLLEIKVCSEYGFNNNRTKSVQDIDEMDYICPLYSKFDGWQKDILNIEEPSDVPCELIYLISEIKRMSSVKEVVVLLKHLEISL